MASSSPPPSKLEKGIVFLLSAVTSALDKAERKAVSSNSDKPYIEDLREIIYEAEDALQDCRTKKLQDQIQGAGTATCGLCWNRRRPLEVRNHVPSPPPSPIPCSSCTGAKLRKLEEKWAFIERRQGYLSLKKEGQNLGESVAARRTPTGSMISQENIYGMEKYKTKLVEVLTSDSETREQYIDDDFKGASCRNLTILPIPGVGQSGKTTLAQLVFNDDSIRKEFTARAWVCASHHQGDNPLKFMKSVLESVDRTDHGSCEFTQESGVQGLLSNKLRGRKFLLVIDDARNKSRDFWSMFCTPELADSVAEGSTIMITTPEYEVIDVLPVHIRRTRPCLLRPLPFEDCMSLFKSMVSQEVLKDKKKLGIGEKIVRKYEGIPGAIKDAAVSLRYEEDIDKWEKVLLRASRDSRWVTSYRALEMPLGRCFLYCALFPKGYLFTRKHLINLWMSEGFVKSKGSKRMEEVGDQYFSELVHKFVLQRENNNDHDMPNPLHDLAEAILDRLFCRLNDRDEGTRFEKTQLARHASFIVHGQKEIVEFKAPSSSLRTYIIINNTDTNSLVQLNLPNNAFSDLGYLRTLDLSYTNLVELPSSVWHLRSLHFLGLNGTLIEALPESLGMLYNLQTLELKSCRKLRALPKSISKLTQLRHLSLDVYLTYFCMPAGFGQLTNLQTLPIFNVGSQSGEHAGLQELGRLEKLQSKLFIRGLSNVGSKDLQSPILKKLKFLEGLTLCWSKDGINSTMQHSSSDEDQNEVDDKQFEPLFDNLKPHAKLQNLSVQFYDGKKLPEWMQDASFKELRYIQLRECKKCETLPSLGRLPSLKDLAINNVGVGAIDSQFGTFPSLQDLTLRDMSEWKEWSIAKEMTFPNLVFLHLANCPKLAKVPEIKYLKELKMKNCSSVTEISNLASLEKLEIYDCKRLTSISSLTSLEKLKMMNCGELKTLHSLASLEELTMNNCGKLTTLPSFPSLNELFIHDSEGLMEISPLPSLKAVILENCGELKRLSSHPLLEYLEMLNCTVLTEIPSLPSLETLKMNGCGKVEKIPDFPCLKKMEIRGCKDLIEFSSLMSLQNPDTRQADKLHAVSVPLSLEILILKSFCEVSIELDKLYKSTNGNSPKLREVDFFNCLKFGCIPEISSVTSLKLENCKKISYLSSFPSLKSLYIYDCDELDKLPTIESLSSLTIMYCGGLKHICDQPELHDLWVESSNQLEIGMLPKLENLFIANSLFYIKCPQAWLQSENFVHGKHITSFTKDGKM